MGSNGAYSVRLRLDCGPDGYTWAQVDWGDQRVLAQGTELTNDAGETYATAHSVSVRFDEGEAQQETWWLWEKDSSLIRQAYSRGAHPGFIQELRQTDTLTVWADTESGTLKAEFDVRNLDYTLSQNPEHCREPDAYGKWVYEEWEVRSGKTGYQFSLYAEGSDDVYLYVWCYANDDKALLMDWGERRPVVDDDGYQIKQSNGELHSTGHPVSVRYGDGITQSANWQLLSPAISSRNRSFPQAYVGSSSGVIAQLSQVGTLTVSTETESETIRAEFDLRRLDKAMSRLNQHCN